MLYYLVPVYDKAKNDAITFNYLITYMADPEDFNAMNAVVEHTINDTTATEFKIENARIVVLPDDVRQFLIEWIENPQYYEGGSFIDWSSQHGIFGTSDKEIIRSKIATYMINKTPTAGISFNVVWLSLGLAAAFVIILLLLKCYRTPSLKDPPGGNEFSRVREMAGD